MLLCRAVVSFFDLPALVANKVYRRRHEVQVTVLGFIFVVVVFDLGGGFWLEFELLENAVVIIGRITTLIDQGWAIPEDGKDGGAVLLAGIVADQVALHGRWMRMVCVECDCSKSKLYSLVLLQ